MVRFHYSNIRVKFEGEDGSGPGVNRGFFASLATEVKSSDTSRPPLNKLGLLFHEPGKQPQQQGLYAPCPFASQFGSSASKNIHIKVSFSTFALHSLYVSRRRNKAKPVLFKYIASRQMLVCIYMSKYAVSFPGFICMYVCPGFKR